MPSLNLRAALKRNSNRPSLKQRAAALKATAARVMGRRTPALPPEIGAPVELPGRADPRLLAMVAELLEARRILNDPSVPDGPEADAIGDRETALSMAVYRFPARSIHDMAAKLPFLRDEAEDAGRAWDVRRGEVFENSLPGAAWAGLLRDIAHLAASGSAMEVSPEPAYASDLSKCSLRQLARLYETLNARRQLAAIGMGAPFLWDGDNYSAAGDILEGEYERLTDMTADIAAEIERRKPQDEDERDERLSVLVRQSIEGSGCISDPALVAEASNAWKA